MRAVSWFCIALTLLVSAPWMHAAESPLVAHWPGAELKAAAGERILLTTPTHLFKLVQRKAGAPAVAESHEGTTDVYFVLSGGGAIVAGGQIEGANALPGMPGEFRGPRITSGTRYELEPDTVINLPPSTPYQIQPGPAGLTAVLLKINVGMHPWSIVSTQQTTLAASPAEARAAMPLKAGQGEVVFWPAADMHRAHQTMADAAAQGRPMNDPRSLVPIPATRTHAYNFLFRTLGANGRPPGVEFHEGNTDIYFVIAGSGTLMTGGEIVDREPIPNRPGEERGPSIRNGKGYPMRPGDVVNMPPNTPHQSLPDPGGFSYLLVKVNVNTYPWSLISK